MKVDRLEDQCNKCLLCVRDCSSGVWESVDGIPTVMRPDWCNLCSHCIAVCPNDAIRHEGLGSASTARVNQEKLQPDVFREIIISRRSIRHFKEKDISRDIIEDVLDLARYAPSASNDQDTGYIVITDKTLLKRTGMDVFKYATWLYDKSQKGILKHIVRLTGLNKNRYFKKIDFARQKYSDPILYNAPVLLLIHAPRKARFGNENCTIAATTIINYAHSLGLGTCLIGFLSVTLKFDRKLRQRLDIPKDRKVHECLVMGYPSYQYAGIVARKKPDIKWNSGDSI